MKIKIGNDTIKVNTLDFLMQCIFSGPARVMRRYEESHERAKEQASDKISYAFVRKDFVDVCVPREYKV